MRGRGFELHICYYLLFSVSLQKTELVPSTPDAVLIRCSRDWAVRLIDYKCSQCQNWNRSCSLCPPTHLDHSDTWALLGSEKGSDELPEAGVGEDATVQVRAVQLGCTDGHRGNGSVRR